MAQPIGNDGNHNRNGKNNVLQMARQRWESKRYGEYNALRSGGDDSGDRCVGEERLVEVAVLIASSLDQSSSRINFRLIS